MRFELFIAIILGAAMYDMYYNNIYSKKILELKRYFQMGALGLGVFSLYLLFKRQPESMHKLLISVNNVIKELPVNRNTSSVPISYISPLIQPPKPQTQTQEGNNFFRHSKSTKRSVSETKKKFVASSQDWKCGNCGNILNAWFEVDHRVRLEHGGSNDANNLVAMCRECHGEKTALENM